MNLIKRHPLIAFFAMTFAITWGIAAILAFVPAAGDYLELLFVLAVCAPTFTSLVLTGIIGGREGLRELFGRLFRWRVGARWYALVLLGVPAVALCAGVGTALLGGGTSGFEFLGTILPWVVFVTLFTDPGPLGEELGWRGFALPRMLDVMGAVPASLLLGAIWGIWHLPAFLLSGFNQSGGNFTLFMVGAVAFTVLMTWLYNNTGGSILVSGILAHLMLNSTTPLPSDGRPYAMYTGLVVLGSIVAVVFSKRLGWRPGSQKNTRPAEARVTS